MGAPGLGGSGCGCRGYVPRFSFMGAGNRDQSSGFRGEGRGVNGE